MLDQLAEAVVSLSFEYLQGGLLQCLATLLENFSLCYVQLRFPMFQPVSLTLYHFTPQPLRIGFVSLNHLQLVG